MIVISRPARNLAFIFSFSIGLLLTARAATAAAPVDLGQGLLYCRVHALPADLPAADTAKSALVLDLRYAAADDAGIAAFSAWLGFRTPAQPVFVLVNSGTGRPLLDTLIARPRPSGVVTLGPALPSFTPDEEVKTVPGTERRAYNAFDHGVAIESLIVEKIDKPRYDEAEMVREHASDSELPPDDTDDTAKPDAAAPKPAPPPQLIDLAIERAVQLHRALLALHKIPQA
ncbi:MAG: hypothetical protein ABSE59_08415 [Opitutaceae bacterium]|jgi:hypothetical protein